MSETMTVEELIARLRGRVEHINSVLEANGVPEALSDAGVMRDAADALEAGLRVAKPFAEVAENDIGSAQSDIDHFRPTSGRGNRAPPVLVGHLRALRNWTKGIYT